MSDQRRIQSFGEFWGHYLSEHRDVRSRRLHVAGTGLFSAVLLGCLLAHPVRMGSCLIAAVVVAFLARKIEARRRALRESLAIVALLVIGSPWVLAGIACAYGCAWVGHFLIEHNRPATFRYPLWSLLGDFRMVGWMLMGRMDGHRTRL